MYKKVSLFNPMLTDKHIINGEVVEVPHWCIEHVVLLERLIQRARTPSGQIDWRAISKYFPLCTIMELKKEALKRGFIKQV